MYFKLTSACIALCLTAPAVQAATMTLDFEDRAVGEIVDTVMVGSVTGQVSSTKGTATSLKEAIVLDTGNAYDPQDPTDGDPDLAAPFYDLMDGPGQPSQDATPLDPGNILVIGEKPGADAGPDAYPDDNANGGKIIFKFDSAVTFLGFDVLDDVTNMVVRGFSGSQGNWTAVGTTGAFSLAYDNQYRTFDDLGWEGITRLVFNFKDNSGGIDNLRFDVAPVPVPGSLPLMLAGLAGIAALRRRKG